MFLETTQDHSTDREHGLLQSTEGKQHGTYFSPIPEAQLTFETTLNKVAMIFLGLCWVCTLLCLSPAACFLLVFIKTFGFVTRSGQKKNSCMYI